VHNVGQPPNIPQRPMGSIPLVIRLVRPDGEEWWPATANRWTDLQIADEPAGTVDASATLNRSGPPSHFTEGETGMRNHFQVVPHDFTMTIEGPNAPAILDCTLYDVRAMLHHLNLLAVVV
jgi:hypothetical protein